MQIIVNGLLAETCECVACAASFVLATQAIAINDTKLANVALSNVSYASTERIYLVPTCALKKELATYGNEGYVTPWTPEPNHSENPEMN